MIIFADMKAKQRKKLPYSWHNILLPIAIGVGVTWWIFSKQLGSFSWGDVQMTPRAWTGIGLAVLMLLAALAGIHDYFPGKTIGSVLLTVLGVLIVLFLLLLVSGLLQKGWAFVYSLANELLYRVR